MTPKRVQWLQVNNLQLLVPKTRTLNGLELSLLECRRKKELSYHQAELHLDSSLIGPVKLDVLGSPCLCKACEGKRSLVTWEGRTTEKWPNPEGSCVFGVILQKTRWEMRGKCKFDIEAVERLLKRSQMSNVVGLIG